MLEFIDFKFNGYFQFFVVYRDYGIELNLGTERLFPRREDTIYFGTINRFVIDDVCGFY